MRDFLAGAKSCDQRLVAGGFRIGNIMTFIHTRNPGDIRLLGAA